MINKLKFEEMFELKGDVVVGKHPEKGDIKTTKQHKILVDKINEIIERINCLWVRR